MDMEGRVDWQSEVDGGGWKERRQLKRGCKLYSDRAKGLRKYPQPSHVFTNRRHNFWRLLGNNYG
jgi:hypothetical protein